MARTLPPIIVAAILAAMLAAPAANAAGLAGNRALDPVARTASASPSPLIAPESACPDQDDLTASAEAQEAAMACMTDYARAATGLAPLAAQPVLAQSASEKAGDVVRCDDFSHFACEHEFTYWMEQVGYVSSACWHVGENLAWGTGEYGTAGSIFRAWMRSPTHRANILGDFGELGIGLRVGRLEGRGGARVWVQHFGARCTAAPAAG